MHGVQSLQRRLRMPGEIHDEDVARDDRHPPTQGGQGCDLRTDTTGVFHETRYDSLRDTQGSLGSLIPGGDSAAAGGDDELRVRTKADFLELYRDLFLSITDDLESQHLVTQLTQATHERGTTFIDLFAPRAAIAHGQHAGGEDWW